MFLRSIKEVVINCHRKGWGKPAVDLLGAIRGPLVSPGMRLLNFTRVLRARRDDGFSSLAFYLLMPAVLFLSGCGGAIKPDGAPTATRTPSDVSAGMQSEFRRALEFMEQNKYSEAVPLLEGIVGKNDQLSGVQINLAIACMNAGVGKEYYEKAEKALLKAVQIDSREPVVYNQLGLLYRRTGRFEESKKAYRQAINLDSDYTMPYLNMGILCDIYLQDSTCAIEYFEKYKLLAPAQAEKTQGWLTDIKRRAGIAEPAVAETAEPEAAAPTEEVVQ